MLSLRTCLLLSLVAACGPKPPQTETTDGDLSTGDSASSSTAAPTTTSPTTTVDPTTGAVSSTGADTSAGFMLPPDEGFSFIMPTDGGGCGAAGPGLRCSLCDLWTQNCLEDEKCSPYSGDGDNAWESQKCVPLDPDPDSVGEPCTVEGSVASGVDSCDVTSMCWFLDPDTLTGTCVPRCTGTPDSPVCPEGTACDVTNDGVLTLCLPTCDPLAGDCPAGQLCIFSASSGTEFVCESEVDDAGQLFADCSSLNACASGLLCTDPSLAVECDQSADGCCLPYCDLTAPPSCPGATQECLPFFPEDPPPGHEDLGVCGIPG